MGDLHFIQQTKERINELIAQLSKISNEINDCYMRITLNSDDNENNSEQLHRFEELYDSAAELTEKFIDQYIDYVYDEEV